MPKNKSKVELATPEEVAAYAPASSAAVTDESAESKAQPKDELTVLRQQVSELQDKLLRARAEAQNIARRAQQEQAAAVRYGCAELLKSLLAVVDDFERTMEAAANTDQVQPVLDGVKLVYDKLMKLLRDNAVEVIEALDQPFDPTEHAAVMQQPTDRHEPGTVIQELERGYRYRDRVLRPSKVVVAKAPEKTSEP